MPPLRRLALLYVPLLALLGFSLSRRPLAPLLHTSAPFAPATAVHISKPPRKRQPLVYVYDWFEHCARIGLCANASLDASREAACREAAGLVEHDWVFVSAAQYLCASAGVYGRVTKAREGFVETQIDHFHIAPLYDARLLRSEWRTRDPDAAALFYVPYDPSIDLYYLRHKPNATFSRAKHDWLVASVLGSPHFARHGGADHFLVVAATRIAANVAFDLLDNGPLANATKLNVELHGGHPKDSVGRIHAHVARSRPPRTSVWAATVYPSFFHATARFRMAVDNPCAQHAGRKTTKVAMAFSLMVPPAARAVRRALLAACAKLGPPQCSSVQLERGANVSASMDSVVELYQRSQYCVVPPGDTLTTKRFFDAVQACCVPVLADADLNVWLGIYNLESIRERIRALVPVTLARHDVDSGLARLAVNDDVFARTVPALAANAFGLSIALEEHAEYFDAVDGVVQALLKTRRSARFAWPLVAAAVCLAGLGALWFRASLAVDYSTLERIRQAPPPLALEPPAPPAPPEAVVVPEAAPVQDNLAPDRPAVETRPPAPVLAPSLPPMACHQITSTLLPLMDAEFQAESCRVRAHRGDNVVLERMVRFARAWDEAHPGAKPFFCDIMVGGPKGLFNKWKPDMSFDAKTPFRWADVVAAQPGNSTRPVTLQFTGGKQFCELFNSPGFAAVPFPVIVVGPMGDDSNWGPFSGGKFSPYFRHREVHHNFESHVCGPGSWARVTDFLEDDRLLLWVTFSQNLEHPKLVSLPLAAGAKFAPRALARLGQSLAMRKTHLMGLTFGDGYNSRTEWRQAIFDAANKWARQGHRVQESGINPFHIADPARSKEDGWAEALRTFQTSKLIVSPGGYGVDTKRPFEALLTGAVPLHLRNGLYKSYRHLPVVFTDNHHLNATAHAYVAAACMRQPRFEKLTWQGWVGFILDVQAGKAHVEDW